MMQIVDRYLMAYGVTVGRMLMGLLFLFSGVGILMNGVDGLSGMIAIKGLPMPMLLAWLVVIWKIGAGGALMLGYRTKDAALALLVFTAVVIPLYHASLQDINLFKNLAIIGGLLYVYVYGPGDGWKLKVGEPKQPTMAI